MSPPAPTPEPPPAAAAAAAAASASAVARLASASAAAPPLPAALLLPPHCQVRLLEPRGLQLRDAQWFDYLALSLAPAGGSGGARFRRSHVTAALNRLARVALDPQLWGEMGGEKMGGRTKATCVPSPSPCSALQRIPQRTNQIARPAALCRPRAATRPQSRGR